jgi:acyl dehydratase
MSQIYFEEAVEGQQISSMEKHITTVNMTMYLSTVWLTDRIHFDYKYATEKRKLPNIIIPGTMAVDYYAQLLNDWAGENAEIRKLSVQFRHFIVPGDVLQCSGKIVKRYIDNGKGYIELQLWMKNQKGINCAPGKGVVELPCRRP